MALAFLLSCHMHPSLEHELWGPPGTPSAQCALCQMKLLLLFLRTSCWLLIFSKPFLSVVCLCMSAYMYHCMLCMCVCVLCAHVCMGVVQASECVEASRGQWVTSLSLLCPFLWEKGLLLNLKLSWQLECPRDLSVSAPPSSGVIRHMPVFLCGCWGF